MNNIMKGEPASIINDTCSNMIPDNTRASQGTPGMITL